MQQCDAAPILQTKTFSGPKNQDVDADDDTEDVVAADDNIAEVESPTPMQSPLHGWDAECKVQTSYEDVVTQPSQLSTARIVYPRVNISTLNITIKRNMSL